MQKCKKCKKCKKMYFYMFLHKSCNFTEIWGIACKVGAGMKVGAGRIRRGELQLHQGTIGAVNWGLPSKLGAGTGIEGSLTEVGGACSIHLTGM